MEEDMKILMRMIVKRYQLQKDKPFIINRNKIKMIFNEEFIFHDDRLYKANINYSYGSILCRKLNMSDIAQIVGMLLCRDDISIQYGELQPISLVPADVKNVIRYVIERIGKGYTFWVNYSTKGASRICFESSEQTAIIPLDEKVAYDIGCFMSGAQLKPHYYMDEVLNATTTKYEIVIEE